MGEYSCLFDVTVDYSWFVAGNLELDSLTRIVYLRSLTLHFATPFSSCYACLTSYTTVILTFSIFLL